MVQTVRDVVLEVQPASAERLRALVSAVNAAEEASEPKYERMRRSLPGLHFMSMTVFSDDQYDPLFVLEVNFDGAPGPFWAGLEAVLGPALRDMLRCAKPPVRDSAELFAAVVASGSQAPIAPLLEACTVRPALLHQGDRGLDRCMIEREGSLFAAARALADDPALRTLTPVAIHAALRAELAPRFAWLAEPARPRVPWLEQGADWLRLIGFGLLALALLGLPALLLWGACPTLLWPITWVLAAIFCLHRLLDLERADPRLSRTSWASGAATGVSLALGMADAVSSLRAGRLGWLWTRPWSHPWAWLGWMTLLFLTGAVAAAMALATWLRLLERADSSQDAPPQNAVELDRIARSEDQIAQNHMISIVHVKPGVLRAILIRAGLWGLGLFLRATRRDGYLATMRTIHFAHWALVSNGARLMFHSNYDGSWESYLDDFIEKAHWGLTLAWTNAVGFPSTRFLAFDGATQGRRFKAWARSSMRESLFWFSAYPAFTVNQIERQFRLAEGLRRTTLSDAEAQTWLLDL